MLSGWMVGSGAEGWGFGLSRWADVGGLEFG